MQNTELNIELKKDSIPLTCFKVRGTRRQAGLWIMKPCECTISKALLLWMFGPLSTWSHPLPLPYLPYPLLAAVQNYNTMKTFNGFGNSGNSTLYSTSYSWWLWLGWLCKTPAIWLPIKSQSIKWSVKLTDAMTCQDCSLYMSSEEDGLNPTIDSAAYGFHPFATKKVHMTRNNHKSKVSVDAGLLQQCDMCE